MARPGPSSPDYDDPRAIPLGLPRPPRRGIPYTTVPLAPQVPNSRPDLVMVRQRTRTVMPRRAPESSEGPRMFRQRELDHISDRITQAERQLEQSLGPAHSAIVISPQVSDADDLDVIASGQMYVPPSGAAPSTNDSTNTPPIPSPWALERAASMFLFGPGPRLTRAGENLILQTLHPDLRRATEERLRGEERVLAPTTAVDEAATTRGIRVRGQSSLPPGTARAGTSQSPAESNRLDYASYIRTLEEQRATLPIPRPPRHWSNLENRQQRPTESFSDFLLSSSSSSDTENSPPTTLFRYNSNSQRGSTLPSNPPMGPPLPVGLRMPTLIRNRDLERTSSERPLPPIDFDHSLPSRSRGQSLETNIGFSSVPPRVTRSNPMGTEEQGIDDVTWARFSDLLAPNRWSVQGSQGVPTDHSSDLGEGPSRRRGWARIDRNGDYVATDEEADLTRAEETRRLRRQHSYRGEQGPSDSRGRYQPHELIVADDKIYDAAHGYNSRSTFFHSPRGSRGARDSTAQPFIPNPLPNRLSDMVEAPLTSGAKDRDSVRAHVVKLKGEIINR